MFQRGIRGAITLDSDSKADVKNAVVELISQIQEKNNISPKNISHVIFTLTKDIKSVYPAKIAREEFKGWNYVPMVCMNEMEIDNSLQKCLRILIVINTELAQNEIKHVYLKGAAKLREDLK
ncbi:chorismate mutase [bacterium]|nr:chorismate mutase [bacterium]